jgi:hypothetical protein
MKENVTHGIHDKSIYGLQNKNMEKDFIDSL